MRPARKVLKATLARLRALAALAAIAVAALIAPPAIDDASAQRSFNRSSMGGGGAMHRGATMSRRPNTQPGKHITSGMGRSGSKITHSNSRDRTHGMRGRGMGGTKITDRGHVDRRRPGHKRPGRHLRPRPGFNPAIVTLPSGGGSPPRSVTRGGMGGGGMGSSGGTNQPTSRAGIDIPPSNEQRYVPNEVVVEISAGGSPQAVEALARRHRLTRLDSIDLQLSGTTIFRWRIAAGRTVRGVLGALARENTVLSAQPNYLAQLQEEAQRAAALGQGSLAQYAIEKLRLSEAHRLATGNRILVAVIDSGIDTDHPELTGMIVDYFDAIGTGDRVHPHGTAIAGAIVARARLKGTAPSARILSVRAFGVRTSASDGTTFSILKGLDWAVGRGARIVNMSFAGPRDPAIARSLAAARNKGIVLVAAAGNGGPRSQPLFPAVDPNVIAVTATDENDELFRAANLGSHIAVAAPGVDLMLPAPQGEYRMSSGTSFAAAEVSGAVALMLELNPNLDPAAVRRALTATARDLGPRGVDQMFGAGLIDPYQALLAVSPVAADTADIANRE
jgi:subtilisin family serine protease